MGAARQIGLDALATENNARLSTCNAPHRFIPQFVDSKINTRYCCEKCGGEVPVDAAVWYAKGQRDGKDHG